jgi:chromosome transmission fidelity protein 18
MIDIFYSDDRSGDVFESKVLNAVEMQANWMGDNKPNCLIIDEIDGITDREGKVEKRLKLNILIIYEKGAVDLLVNLVNGTRKIKTKKKKDNNKTETSKLLRPIICICNNQYVPALKKLRAVATVFNFEKPKLTKLVQRLKVIFTRIFRVSLKPGNMYQRGYGC